MRAFAPAHITGFFVICEDPDPLRTGSCGAGLSLDDGVQTEAVLSEDGMTRVFLNGVESEAITTRTLISQLTDRPVKVESRLSIPSGGGLGASAAGAMSTALALNRLLGLNRTFNELCYAAHIAEVTSRTGLGDVAGMSNGGVEIRLKPGVPFVLDRIQIQPMYIYYIHFGPISTKSVLSDEHEKEQINESGRKCLKALLKKPTFEEFMRLSRDFSVETGLISDKVLKAVEAVEAAGGLASMAMLGDTVFSTKPDGLREFGMVKRSRINMTGPIMMEKGRSEYFNDS
ncbi:MAG TPA: pantoate kinase [Methanocella sp.]|nr:pantoate kinase [Methanocella sp.]